MCCCSALELILWLLSESSIDLFEESHITKSQHLKIQNGEEKKMTLLNLTAELYISEILP